MLVLLQLVLLQLALLGLGEMPALYYMYVYI